MEAKSIFKMSVTELQQATTQAADAVKKRAWNKGGYISYFEQSSCPDSNFMVREYQNRKELVRLNDQGEATFIRVL